MCDPLTIAGAVLTVGSVAANSFANAKVMKARNDALAAERIRQRGLQQEADALNAGALNRYEDFSGQQDASASRLAAMFQAPAETPAAANDYLPPTTSNVTINEEAKQRGKARAETNEQAIRLGGLRSFGDVLSGIGRLQGRDASKIGQIGNFRAGSANVLPLELDVASRRGDKLRTVGQILGAVGQAGIGAGLQGADLAGSLPAINFGLKPNVAGGASNLIRLTG